jgi:hypothetical protein
MWLISIIKPADSYSIYDMMIMLIMYNMLEDNVKLIEPSIHVNGLSNYTNY